jgi:hypothetical protein
MRETNQVEKDADKFFKECVEGYRITRDEDGMPILNGKFGRIEPDSSGTLGVYVTSDMGWNLTAKMVLSLKRRLKPFMGHLLNMDGEFYGRFGQEHLDKVAFLTGIKKKRRLSKEHIEKCKATMFKRLTNELP